MEHTSYYGFKNKRPCLKTGYIKCTLHNIYPLQVTTVFCTVYTSYTRNILDTCYAVLEVGFKNLNIGKVFDNITCENETANYTLAGNLLIRDEYVKCPQGMKLRNVSSSESVGDIVQQFCGEYNNVTNINMFF